MCWPSRAGSSVMRAQATLSGCLSLGQRGIARNCRRPTPRVAQPRPAALKRSQEQPAEIELSEETSTSGRSHLWQSRAIVTAGQVAAVAAAVLLPALSAHAGETAPDGFLEFIIENIEALGPWGPAAFVVTVAIAECIPLFPTQPLSLASGLLFGVQKGALCILSGGTLAALLAFLIARGIGRPLAERIIKHEVSEGKEEGLVQKKLAEVTGVIERGSFWQQAGAVLLLRLTPVVPFSASNYVLGLSPLPLPPYLAGTAAGLSLWGIFYASIGGASRSLLRRGVDPDVLLAEMLAKVGEYTRELAIVGALLGTAGLVYLGAGVVKRQMAAAGPAGEELNNIVTRGIAAAGQELADARKEAVQLSGWLGPAAEDAVGAAAQAAAQRHRAGGGSGAGLVKTSPAEE